MARQSLRSPRRPLRGGLWALAALGLGAACAPAPAPTSRPASPPTPDASAPSRPAARRNPAAAPGAKARPGATGPRAAVPWVPPSALVRQWQEAAWRHDRSDARGSGATASDPIRLPPRVLWRFAPRAAGELHRAVVVGGGLVYFGSSEGTVYAVEVATGKLRWKQSEKGKVRAAPALGQGTLYVALADSGTVVAYRAESGDRLWTRAMGGPALGAPLVDDSRVYLGNGAPGRIRSAGALHALSAATGKVLWKRSTGVVRIRSVKRTQFLGGLSARPALAADGRIYATSQDGFLHVVDSRTGKARQREMIESRAEYTPAIDGDLAFFHRSGQLYTLGPPPGKILGFFTKPPKPLGTGLGSPALTTARIYVAGDGALVARGRQAQTPLWKVTLPAQTDASRHSAPVVAGAGTAEETVYVVDAQGTLHAVDGASGKALWTLPLGGRPATVAAPEDPTSPAAPALLPRLILVSTPGGEVVALTDAK